MKHSIKDGHYALYGIHAVQAALENPARVKRTLYTTKSGFEKLTVSDSHSLASHIVDAKLIESLLPMHAVHQGVALEVQPLPQPDLTAMAETGKPLIMLDQVSDPHNIGAILRSAAAFDAGGVIVQDKNAPRENATIAKIAAGAMEKVPFVKVTNLSRTLEALRENGYWSIGLDGDAKEELSQLSLTARSVLVMGAEGAGLRPLVAKNCDMLAKLPIHPQMESLNVSVATGISLYALQQKIV